MKKHVLFIYQRREILVFMSMAMTMTLFAFTLGLHMGKEISIPMDSPAIHVETKPVSTLNDQIPNLQELTAPGEDALENLDQRVTQETRIEIGESGLKVDHPRQLTLPKKPQSHAAGATTLKNVEGAVGAQTGTFALQVGSFPSFHQAEEKLNLYKEAHLNPSLRAVDIPGKGKGYRIYLGGFPSAYAAEQAGQIYRSQRKIKNYMVIKLEN